MSVKNDTKEETINEAISILEEETKRRIQVVEQRIEFICASLRAQGNTQINKMLMAIRELTMEEFCETYEANTQNFLKQNQLNNRKRRLDSFGKQNESKKKKSGSNTEMEFTTLSAEKIDIHVQIDPNHKSQVQLNIPEESLNQLNEAQKLNVHQQIQQLVDQLNTLKSRV